MSSLPSSALLLADDDEANRYVLRRILESAGYRVIESGTAAETRRLVSDASDPPALVILDVHLPDGNGYELCRAFKSDANLAKIPVLQMSAMFTRDTDRVQGLECGADSYLIQPVDPGVLIATVRALLRIGKIEAEREELLARERAARREAELEREKLRSFFMLAPAAVWVLRGPDHVFELVNPPARALTGDRDVRGMAIRDALPEFEAQGNVETLNRVFRTGEACAVSEREYRTARPEGGYRSRFFNFSYQAWRDIDGAVAGVLAFAMDVTDQVLARQQVEDLAVNLKNALTARDSFLSIASHELKTPLTSLKLQSQMGTRALSRDGVAAFSPEKIRKLVEGTDRQVDRLNRLVEDMLDIARIQTGKLTLRPEPVELRSLVAELLDRHSSQLGATGATFTLHAGEPVRGCWDRDRVEQVALNLLSNAAKYGDGKPVAVTVESIGDRAVLSVRDRGIGVAPDKQQIIFEQFERAASPESISGLGLGLYIVRNIVSQHGGSVRLESELGRGSTFIVELPCDALPEYQVGEGVQQGLIPLDMNAPDHYRNSKLKEG